MTLHVRFDTDSMLRRLAFLLAALLFALSLWYVWTAFSFPLELEIREGTGWIHALAKRADVDIYDSSRVTFVNMNHGPMDSITKGWIAALFPSLASLTDLSIAWVSVVVAG